MDKNNEVVYPNQAAKGIEYRCPKCFSKVILKKGKIRKPHFSHYVQLNRCDYYDSINESKIHFDAKNQLAEWLRNGKKIRIGWECSARLSHGGTCCSHHSGMEKMIKVDSEDLVVVEYRDPVEHYVADVAVLSNQKVKYIFEIYYTHATEKERPEPWFEISANSVLQEGKIESNDLILLSCIRNEENNIDRYCNCCKSLKEGWVINIPYVHYFFSDRNPLPCIKCRRQNYKPVFYCRYLQICKNCLTNCREELKKEYDFSELESNMISDPSELERILSSNARCYKSESKLEIESEIII